MICIDLNIGQLKLEKAQRVNLSWLQIGAAERAVQHFEEQPVALCSLAEMELCNTEQRRRRRRGRGRKDRSHLHWSHPNLPLYITDLYITINQWYYSFCSASRCICSILNITQYNTVHSPHQFRPLLYDCLECSLYQDIPPQHCISRSVTLRYIVMLGITSWWASIGHCFVPCWVAGLLSSTVLSPAASSGWLGGRAGSQWKLMMSPWSHSAWNEKIWILSISPMLFMGKDSPPPAHTPALPFNIIDILSFRVDKQEARWPMGPGSSSGGPPCFPSSLSLQPHHSQIMTSRYCRIFVILIKETFLVLFL